MKSPEMGPGSQENQESAETNKALEAAVCAIYFDDSADYETALYKVVHALDQTGTFEEILLEGEEDDQEDLYDGVKKSAEPGSQENQGSAETNKALEAAVEVLYFGDSADYGTALYKVIDALDRTRTFEKILLEGSEAEQSDLYNRVKKSVDPNYEPIE